ncbi:clan AA aspartic protease [Longimicrobium sp.]|uniref:clan AA aspartic protease n=1 Tax=Longimicrobium sp. TaxID=2029185 RepID=UPI003B3B9D9D
MIRTTVNQWLEPTLDLTIHGPDGQRERMECKIDTGFEGALTLHSAVVAALGLPRVTPGRAVLADGSATTFPVHRAVVDWGGARRQVNVHVADSVSLLGMAMLAGHELRVEAIPDGPVEITPITKRAA